MARTHVSERLIKRIEWLASPDPTWTAEDGRPTTRWAATQALALLERVMQTGALGDAEPQVTATARGGIELVWQHDSAEEVDVVIPADPGQPIEVARIHRRWDGTIAEDEHKVWSVDAAAPLFGGQLEA
jgi:hypothetical protein